ncbi:MAG TPA: secretin N-terminal domain-containing protein [Gemmatimonadaceae bacterium]|nr:secretin N-terminal domain-containing protein [Gemmatimonadaceae bacterium]
MNLYKTWAPAVTLLMLASTLTAQTPVDTVSIRLIDADLRAAVQLLSQYIDRPVIITNVPTTKVTIETPRAVRRSDVLGLLRATLESQNLELVVDTSAGPSGPYRIQQREVRAPQSYDPMAGRRNRGDMRLYVLRLRHARASDVAATVNALYGKASAFGEQSAPPPTLAQQLQQNQVPPLGAQAQSAAAISGHDATLSGETTIIPDASTNSLLVRASQSDYELIAAAVKELDIRPLQVLIQVLIAEVRRDRSLTFGVDVTLPSASLPGHPNTTFEGSQQGLGGIGDAILRVVGIGGDKDLAVTLSAAAARGDVTIVSRPTVIAVNNERAEISVGSQRPFIQVSRSLPTDAPSRDQVVQYKDVGTKLSVRPTISADGYVMLQVTQEVSAATTETQFDAPVISTRSVQTQLLLKDGQTVILGGLSDRQRDVSQQGVPILSSIPLIGGLFGRVSRRTTETELFLFITPRIIADDAEADAVTKPAQDRAKVKEQQ